MSDGLDKLQPDAPMTLDVLHGRYAAWFRARLVRRYGAQDAEDLLQEAWLRLAPYQGLAGVRHPRALLLKIASNLAADKFGRRRRRDLHAGETVATQGWNIELPSQTDEMFAKQVVMGLPQPLRDRIVIGEMRDGAAALETLKSWNTGHPGGLSTLHANSAEDVLRRLEDLIGEVAVRMPRRLIGQSVDRIVHISRTKTGRRVTGVLGVHGEDDGAYRIDRLA